MSPLFWASAVVVFLIVELATGTLFFLALAVSAALTALAAPLVPDTPGQVYLACALSGVSCLLLALRRKKRNNAAIADNSLDIGRSVYVPQWKDGRARVKYRGAMWDAVPKEGVAPVPGRFRIAGFDSTTLILEPES